MKIRDQDWLLIAPNRSAILRGPIPTQELKRRILAWLLNGEEYPMYIIEEARLVILGDAQAIGPGLVPEEKIIG